MLSAEELRFDKFESAGMNLLDSRLIVDEQAKLFGHFYWALQNADRPAFDRTVLIQYYWIRMRRQFG